MTSNSDKRPNTKMPADARTERLAQQLRANLHKRKQQARSRKDNARGKSDNSDLTPDDK